MAESGNENASLPEEENIVDGDIEALSLRKEETGVSKERKKIKKKVKSKKNYWPIKITVITFFLSLFFSFISEITTKNSNIVVAAMLLVLLIMISIIFDGIGVSVTSCDLAPLNAMAAKKVSHAKVAIALVKNAEKVNNICADVIGDICGIVSGACGSALVIKILDMTKGTSEFIIAILVSAFIAALTVGGKAFEKAIAIKNSQEFVMFTARIIGIFYHPDKKKRKKKNAGNNK